MVRVLIVDDNRQSLDALEALLIGYGCEVDTARHGAEALVRTRRQLPDVIITELLIPVMDGYTLLRYWRLNGQLQAIPFVVYSAAVGDARDEQLALQMGADAFIAKPMEPVALFARIQAVLAQSQRSPGRVLQPAADDAVVARQYNDALLRKLENKQLELELLNRELATREARLRAVFDTGPECVKLLSANGLLLDMNPAGLRMIEADSLQQVVNQCLYPLLVEADREAFRELVAKVFRGESAVLQFQIIGLKGSRRWLETHSTPLRNEQGGVSALLGITRDITQRKQAEEQLRRSQAQYRSVVEDLPMLVCRSLPDGTIEFINAAYAAHVGKTPEELLGMNFLELIPADERQRVLANLATLNAARPLMCHEHAAVAPDGTRRFYRWTTRALFNDQDQLVMLQSYGEDLTEREQAEQALRDSEEKFSAAFRASPVALVITTLDSRCVEVNRAFCELIGCAREDIIGKSMVATGLVSQEERARLVAEIDRSGGKLAGVELSTRVRDGSVRDIVYSVTTISLQGVSHRLSMGVDITDRKRAVAALRNSEERYRCLFAYAPDGIVVADTDGRYLDANDSACRMFGYTREELVGMDASRLVVQAELRHIEPALDAIKRHADYHREWRFRRKDGSAFSAEVMATMMPDGNLIAMIRDITERQRTQAHIRELNRTYAVLSDINQLIVRERLPQNILDGACRIAVDKGGFKLAWIGLIGADAGALEMTAQAGATPDTIAVLRDMFADPQAGCAFTAQAIATGGQAVCNDIEHDALAVAWRAAAQQRGYCAMASFPLMVGNQCIGVFNLYADRVDFFDAEELTLLDELARDIGFAIEGCERERERQRAQEDLRRNEERFRALIEGASDLITVLDAAGVIRYQSPSALHVLGYEPQEMVMHSVIDFVHPEDAPMMSAAIGKAMHLPMSSVPVEFRIRHRDGSWRQLQSIGRSLPDEAPEGFIVMNSRDVTERHALEQQLAQSQKMQALGTLAGGIAHDFNNLLSAITGNAELIRMDLGAAHPALPSVGEIERAGQRAKELVQRILTFSRSQEHQLLPMQLQPVLDEAVRLLRATLPAGVELRTQSAPALPLVRADASQMHQVILNLVTNAWHAMEGGGGCIDIHLEAADVSEVFCELHPELHPGPHVRLAVIDHGAGMDAATRARIFEPFFTTKPPGHGTGLGLPVVHGIVRGHHGAILVDSRPGQGSTFQVYLPTCAADVVAADVRPASVSAAPAHGERVLYVDDEEPLVYLATRMLKRLGYQVRGFKDAAEALAAFRADPDGFDVIITDYNMPGMSGMELAQQLLIIDPAARIALSSGYLQQSEINRARALGISEIVQKPNGFNELGTVVQRLLSIPRNPGRRH